METQYQVATDEGGEVELERARSYVLYQWDCPHCDGVNEHEDDPQGTTQECVDCGEAVAIYS